MVISHELPLFNSFVTYLPLVLGGWVLSAKIAMHAATGAHPHPHPTHTHPNKNPI